MEEFDLKKLRQQIGYVMQEPILFNTSIKQNILFGEQDATDQEVYDAAKAANALEFIEAGDSFDGEGLLHPGFDKNCGIKGSKLSGG